MNRTLFLTLRSPFARKAQLMLIEKALPFEMAVVDLSARSAAFVAISPLGKVPVLQDEDGTVVFDSTVIAEYLEDCYPETPMFGVGTRQRLLHRQLDELGDTAAEQAVTLFFSKDKAALDKAQQQLHKSFREISARIARGEVPKDFGVGQAAVICTLGYLEFRLGRTTIEAYPAIEQWLAPFADRKSVLAAPGPQG
jgi:glutathione S-transferase